MSLTNAEVAARLLQLAQLLQSQGENRFKVRAYKNAAEILKQYPKKISELVKRGEDLTEIQGVGAGISAAVVEIIGSGTLQRIKTLGKDLSPGTMEIAEGAAVSISDAKRIMKKLGVTSVEELKEKLESGDAIRLLGSRLEFKIKQGLLKIKRLLWWEAESQAEEILEFILAVKGVTQAEIAGSFRRKRETVGSFRFVVETASPKVLRNALSNHGGVERVLEDSKERISYLLSSGPLLVVRFSERRSWGDAMVAETGSLAHLEEVRKDSPRRKKSAPASTERDWYEMRGLTFVEPELREGRGELEAAKEGDSPKLLQLSDIQGDLHSHTVASDGTETIEDMVEAARSRGYSYLAITDHSQSLKLTNGLTVPRLLEQMENIDKLNSKLKGFRILKGSEVDILEDGSLDYPDHILSKLDIIICSVHSKFNLPKKKQTERFLRVLDNRYAQILGHLTGRLLLRRPGYELDTELVLKRAKANGKFLEINSSPNRLDIDDATALRAKQLGIPLVVNTDAHSLGELDYMRIGVQQARRGWQEKGDILNTLPVKKLLERLSK